MTLRTKTARTSGDLNGASTYWRAICALECQAGKHPPDMRFVMLWVLVPEVSGCC
jgi:hypothetical protein